MFYCIFISLANVQLFVCIKFPRGFEYFELQFDLEQIQAHIDKNTYFPRQRLNKKEEDIIAKN